MLENKGRGLGLMKGSWHGVPDSEWFGGQVQQSLGLFYTKSEGFTLKMEPLEMRRSNRLTRFMGSRRVIQVRVRVTDAERRECEDDMLDFLCHPFVVGGRIFMPAPPKDGSLYMIEINQDLDREPGIWCADQHRLSYSKFLRWHNPMDLNLDQVSHWCSPFLFSLHLCT